MADVRDLFYHGVRHQMRRVFQALGPERLDNAITAFEDGHSSWSDCFFARAFPELNLNSTPNPEKLLASKLGFSGITPIRIVWHTFDSLNHYMTKSQMVDFVNAVRDDMRPAEVVELLRSINLNPLMSDLPVEVKC